MTTVEGFAEKLLTGRNALLFMYLLGLIWLLGNYETYSISASSILAYASMLVASIVLTKFDVDRITSTGYEDPITVFWTNSDGSIGYETHSNQNSLEKVAQAIVVFSFISFIGSVVIFGLQGRIREPLGFTTAWPIFVSQLLLVVPTEALVFQVILQMKAMDWSEGVIEDYTTRQLVVFGFVTGFFAFMHWTAYGGNLFGMLAIFAQALLWSYAASRYGVWAAIIPHLIWNLFALQVFGW